MLIRGNHPHSAQGLTEAFLALLPESNDEALQLLLKTALEVVDEYLSQGSEDSVFKESEFEGNLNSWFKLEALGKGADKTYRLNSLLHAHKIVFGRGVRDQPSPRDLVDQAITETHP